MQARHPAHLRALRVRFAPREVTASSRARYPPQESDQPAIDTNEYS
jgi:hypothetical protein